jgi:flagellin-like hook-associated protein FlgL
MIGSIGSGSSAWNSLGTDFFQSVKPIYAKWNTQLALSALGELAGESSGVSPYSVNPVAARMMDAMQTDFAVQSQALVGAGYAEAKSQQVDSSLSQVNNLLTTVQVDILSMADGTMTDTQKAAKQSEIASALQTIDLVGNTTSFAGQRLLDGKPITYNPTTNPQSEISFTPPKVSTGSLGNDTSKLSDLSTLLEAGKYDDAMKVAKDAQSTILNGRAAGGNFSRAVQVETNIIGDQMVNTAKVYDQAASTVYSQKSFGDSMITSAILNMNRMNSRYQILNTLQSINAE